MSLILEQSISCNYTVVLYVDVGNNRAILENLSFSFVSSVFVQHGIDSHYDFVNYTGIHKSCRGSLQISCCKPNKIINWIDQQIFPSLEGLD